MISGTPTQAGSNLVTFTVQDSVAATTNREIGIVIQAAPYSGDRYVSPNGNNTPPYSNWVTAAHTIQDAVNAASSGTCVWVSNGIYTNGMHDMSGVFTSNRVVIDKTIRVESLNGPEFTIIGGNGESEPHLRCVYLAAGATLSGFTIENGFADVVVESVTTNGETVFAEGVQTNFGGGVLAEDQTAVVTNCLFIGNRVNGDGGAFYGGSGFNCTFLSNSAITFNGSSSLDNPTTKGGATRYAALNQLHRPVEYLFPRRRLGRWFGSKLHPDFQLSDLHRRRRPGYRCGKLRIRMEFRTGWRRTSRRIRPAMYFHGKRRRLGSRGT